MSIWHAGLTLLLASSAVAQDGLQDTPNVRKALQYLESNHDRHFAKQLEITEIPAPTFHEAQRARFMEQEFRRVALRDVEIDQQGNVLGWRPGKSTNTLVVAAHLDISFAPGVNTKIRREGPRYLSPGIGDDSRGLAALLAIAEALNHASIETERTLLFVANVGEEGLGDLAGVKYLFQKSPHRARLDSFISIDVVDPSRVVNGGTGVKRYRLQIKGPGGHSYGNFGRPNAIHAAGRMINRLAAIETPQSPKTTYNVGKIAGGTTINAIAEECTIEIDLRSDDSGELDKLELKMLDALRLAVAEENDFRKASATQLTFESKLIGYRPAGKTDSDSPITRAAIWASRITGHSPRLEFHSTDANLPISLKLPALTLGGGGRGDNSHSLDEWYEPTNGWKGPQMVLLTILAFGSQ